MKHFLRLVGYECRKAFGNPGIVLFLAALLALNGWKIQDQYHRATGAFDPYKRQYQETYATYSGTSTAEKAQKIMAIYRPLDEKLRNMQLSGEYDPNAYTYSEATDEQFFGMLFVYEMQYDYYYRNNAISIVENARTLAQSPNVSAYIARENTRIAWDFSGRSIPNFTDTRGSHVLLNYDYSTMLALLMCIFGLCGVFVREQESEMSMLLPTTRYGTGATVAAKLTAAVLFLLGIGILSLDGESGGLNRGDVLTLVCGVLYAAQIISVGRCNERMDTYALIVLEFAFAALTGLCWSLATERGMPIQWNMQSIGSILYVAVFSTMLASSCQNIAQKLAPTSHAALLMSLESVFGALSGVIFLGEKLTIRMGMGFLVIFAAVVLSETTASSKKIHGKCMNMH